MHAIGNRPGKLIKRAIYIALCGLVVWIVFTEVFMDHCSGANEYRGLPTVDLNKLHTYLSSQGFVACPLSAVPHPYNPAAAAINLKPLAQIKADLLESFSGNYEGSRPIFVTISVVKTNICGVSVETSYDYYGLKWSVDDASERAKKFSTVLNQWLNERAKASLGQ